MLKRCIYGVDLNPMAVELAKVSLWLDAFTLGAPLLPGPPPEVRQLADRRTDQGGAEALDMAAEKAGDLSLLAQAASSPV